MNAIKHTALGAARGTGATALVLIVAPLLCLGVPLFWVFVASKLAGSDPDINVALALFITTGIIVTYWDALLIALTVRTRWVGEEERKRKVRRMSWNRSFRDEPYRPATTRATPSSACSSSARCWASSRSRSGSSSSRVRRCPTSP